MRPSLRAAIAASIDAPPEALPWIDAAFADMPSLGSAPRRLARWLADAGLTHHATLLDLGCGKGAAAIEVVRLTGCRAVGVDGFSPFIERARALAQRRGLADRCRFLVDDVRPLPGSVRPLAWAKARYHAAMMVGVLPLDEAAAALRPLVRRDGVYLIDDCIDTRPDASPGAALDAPLSREEARAFFEQTGDEVLREHIPTPSQVLATERVLMDRMARRIEVICRQEPAAREPLRELLRRQRAAAGMLAGRYRPAMWLIRRVGWRRAGVWRS